MLLATSVVYTAIIIITAEEKGKKRTFSAVMAMKAPLSSSLLMKLWEDAMRGTYSPVRAQSHHFPNLDKAVTSPTFPFRKTALNVRILLKHKKVFAEKLDET